jgi:hypothetical protein
VRLGEDQDPSCHLNLSHPPAPVATHRMLLHQDLLTGASRVRGAGEGRPQFWRLIDMTLNTVLGIAYGGPQTRGRGFLDESPNPKP